MRVPFQRFDRLYEQYRDEYKLLFDKVMTRGNFILGEEVNQFEEEFAKYCNSRYCVGVGSGLDALTLSLLALDFNPGDEILVPANTYIATWIAVSRAGLKPVPVEPEEEGFQIDVNHLKEHITSRTKGIIPVHLYYQTPDMDSLNDIAEEHNLRVVADAAQGHGAFFKNKIVGSTAEIEAFSFFPTKNLGAFGDGGAVVTNNEEVVEKIRMLRNYGTREKYVSEVIGYNSRLDEIQAAFLRQKLRHLDEWNNARKQVANRYLNELDDNAVKLPVVKDYAIPNWYVFPIMCNFREELSNQLEKSGIHTIVHYPIPPYEQKAYSDTDLDISKFPISTEISKKILSIPIHPYMTAEEIQYVIENINAISKKLEN